MSVRSFAHRNFLRQLIWILFVVVALTAVSFGLARELTLESHESHVAESIGAAAGFANAVDNVAPAAHDEFAAGLADALGAERVTLFTPSGAVLADAGPNAGATYPYGIPSEVLGATRRGRASVTRRNAAGGAALIHVARLVSGPEATETLVVRVSHKRRTVLSRVTRSFVIVSYVALGLLAAAATYLWYQARKYGHSLESVVQAAEAYAHGDLAYRAAVDLQESGLDEVARNLNDMAYGLGKRLAEVMAERDELETILSNMVEGVILLDANTHIRSLNGAARRLFPGGEREAAGRSLVEFTRNAEIDEFARAALSSRTPAERTIAIYENDIQYLQLHGSVLLDSNGEPDGVVLVLSDVTRLKRLENIRKDFVANVSHELKTPITSILGFVETLTGGAIKEPERAERFLGIIADHTRRLNDIVDDLLTLSRLESQEQEIAREWVDVSELLNAVLTAVAPQAERKSVELYQQCDCSADAYVNASLIQQAVTNLVDNAVKYSGAGSRVGIEVSRSDGELRISVRDTGPGIPKRDLNRVFERFYRVDRARSRALGGTGLGLSIVKHIAQSHGGTVEAQSELGVGSTFSIVLPQQTTAQHGKAGSEAGS